MKSMIENNEFVENAEFSGNMYGTSKKSIQDVLDNGIQAWFILIFLLSVQIIKIHETTFKIGLSCFLCLYSGKICILDIDVQGVKAIKKVDDIPKPLYVFMKPPSLQVLEERLRARGTETEESLQKVSFYNIKSWGYYCKIT